MNISSPIGVLILLMVIILLISINERGDIENYELKKLEVREGDTLYSIAGKYKHKDDDIRWYIYKLKEINNIDSQIYPGQTIYIFK